MLTDPLWTGQQTVDSTDTSVFPSTGKLVSGGGDSTKFVAKPGKTQWDAIHRAFLDHECV